LQRSNSAIGVARNNTEVTVKNLSPRPNTRAGFEVSIVDVVAEAATGYERSVANRAGISGVMVAAGLFRYMDAAIKGLEALAVLRAARIAPRLFLAVRRRSR
jgi:hypothetical protein